MCCESGDPLFAGVLEKHEMRKTPACVTYASHSQATWKWLSTQLCLVCHVTSGKDMSSGWASVTPLEARVFGVGFLNCNQALAGSWTQVLGYSKQVCFILN